MKAIVNGKIILKDKIIENFAILYTDKIIDIVKNNEICDNAEIIDANGGYVAPGLIDLHIHGYLGKDVCDGEEESIRTISKGLLANGVTGYLPTTMTEDMCVIRKALEVCRELQEVMQKVHLSVKAKKVLRMLSIFLSLMLHLLKSIVILLK